MPGEAQHTLAARLRALAALVRGVAGMPDYERYVAHLRAAHPGVPVPSEREYLAAYVEHRYRPGSRCC